MGVFQLPGSNALATAEQVARRRWTSWRKSFPPGVDYTVVYNPTQFIAASVHEVINTIFEASAGGRSWSSCSCRPGAPRSSPSSPFRYRWSAPSRCWRALGYSLNNLSLFGLVLAVGIVVDDAIVVVENVERNLREGMTPRDAAHVTMDEVGGALVAIALVLSAVFIPAAFIPGISGQFFRQFAVTIAASTVISLVISLTLSPALAALLFKTHSDHETAKRSRVMRSLAGASSGFNNGFDWLAGRYGSFARR